MPGDEISDRRLRVIDQPAKHACSAALKTHDFHRAPARSQRLRQPPGRGRLIARHVPAKGVVSRAGLPFTPAGRAATGSRSSAGRARECRALAVFGATRRKSNDANHSRPGKTAEPWRLKTFSFVTPCRRQQRPYEDQYSYRMHAGIFLCQLQSNSSLWKLP